MEKSMIKELRSAGRRLDSLYVEAGRRAHIMGRIDGSFGGFREVSREIVNPPGGGTEGIWVEPIRLLDYVHFYIWDPESGLSQIERNCERYIREVGYSRFLHRFASHPYLEVEKHIWVPRQAEAVVVSLVLKNISDQDRSLRLFAGARSNLSLGWPRRDAGPDLHRLDRELQAVVAMDERHPDWTAVWGADQPLSACHLGASDPGILQGGNLALHGPGLGAPGRSCSFLQYDLKIPALDQVRLNLVVAGGNTGPEHAALVYLKVREHAAELLQERIAHYRAIMETTVRLATPDYLLDKAFLWAKVGTEDFKHFDPQWGLCYFAGFPAYNFYFASDSFRILHGAICTGDFEDAKEILRMILKYQAWEPGPDTLPGEIWHEMSTTGDRIAPNFCTLDFPPLAEYFFRWTGERDFLAEIYPNIKGAVEWGYLNDKDGDGLLENGPEGEMADSAFEDTNMERSHLGPNLSWYRALQSGARLATQLGDNRSAARWRQTADELQTRLNLLYWNEHQHRFEETIRPDGYLDSSWRGITVYDSEIVDEGKARFGLRKLLEEEERLVDPKAFARWQESEKGFQSWREHLSWYLVARGDRARILLNHHFVEAGIEALSHIARVVFDTATPGQFPEVIGMDDLATPYVRGCPHQAWSAACGILYPVISGLFGIVPDAAAHAMQVDPHFPSGWPQMSLSALRVGDHHINLTYRRQEDRLDATLENDSRFALHASFGFPLPLDTEIVSLTIDESSLGVEDPRISIVASSEDFHLYIETEIPAGASSTAAVIYQPAALELRSETYLERALPGAQLSIPVQIVNTGRSQVRGKLILSTPDSWPPPASGLEQSLDLSPGGSIEMRFDLEVPANVPAGYRTLWARFEGPANVLVARPIYLPVFPSVQFQLDGRGIARERSSYVLRLTGRNLSKQAVEAEIDLELPWRHPPAGQYRRISIQPDQEVELSFLVETEQPGEFTLPLRFSAPGTEEHASHRLTVVPPGQSIIVYSGFLGCPITSDEEMQIVNLPANYAVRRPIVMNELLSQADLFLTSDQHDAEFTAQQVKDLVRYVEQGGNMLLFCYWSSPWGRGFYDTYGNVAGTRLAEILPLDMKRSIGTGSGVQLQGMGSTVLGELPWHTCPPYDFNHAVARPTAEVWARNENGDPIIASQAHGRGWVVAIAIDCFGYGNFGTFLRWPGVAEMIRRTVRYMARRNG